MILILFSDSIFDMAWYFGMFIDKFKPLNLSDEKTLANCISFIDKDSSSIEGNTICPNNIRILKSENHVWVSVYLKSYFIRAIHHEYDFCNFIQFMQ